jgi:hypothetical protein
MKRLSFSLVLALALIAMLAFAAQADCGNCSTKSKGCAAKASGCVSKATGCGSKSAASASTASLTMGECCRAAVEAGKGCCGMDAEATKAHYANFVAAEKQVKQSMHECCAAAMAASKGCCGKDAEGVRAAYAVALVEVMAESSAKQSMHECCVAALAASKGCCGKDAEALQAEYTAAFAAAKKACCQMSGKTSCQGQKANSGEASASAKTTEESI